jgi:FlaA1/EpsC-like NDP-sugar epimerase
MFRKAQRGEKRVLIYGANPLGLVTLQNILNFESPTIEPIGFLDEDPSLEGTELNGYPILGGHLKLESTLDRRDVHSIILCENDLPPLVFGQIWAAARSRGVVIRRPRIGMEDVSTNVQRAQPEVLTYAA